MIRVLKDGNALTLHVISQHISSATCQSFSRRNYRSVCSQHLLHINDCLMFWISIDFNKKKLCYSLKKDLYPMDSGTLPLNHWDQNFVIMWPAKTYPAWEVFKWLHHVEPVEVHCSCGHCVITSDIQCVKELITCIWSVQVHEFRNIRDIKLSGLPDLQSNLLFP